MELVLLVLVFAVEKCFGKGMEPNIFAIDMNDILDERLMPATFLMLEGPENPMGQSKPNPQNDSSPFVWTNLTNDDGTFGTAFSTMKFHRKMINSYLCHGFLANQLMSEVMPRTDKFSKRTGTSPMMTENDYLNVRNSMLYDQGSSGYKDWLSKTSTLDDIHRNYLSQSIPVNNNSLHHRTDSPRATEDDYFDEGFITGYAVQQSDPQPGYHSSFNSYQNPYPVYGPQAPFSKDFHQHELLLGEASYDSARGDYSYYHPMIDIEEKSVGKGIGLRDLFDIALTTLAFLSFGMFILQVIMCITMTKTDANMMMIPTVDGGEIDGAAEVEIRRRTARSLPISDGARLREINAIARMVLNSMDATVYSTQDQGQCSQQVICKGNRFSRELKYTKRYWMAVWNLGASWLTGNMVAEEARSSTILGCLRAMIIGLGGGECDKTFRCSKDRQHQ
ncbi:uncharacterized protein LOC131431737 [Malaya genurostris]|uniref:uncharacterized protein LOC131431737 n=1 Tax=Malaya genurostris TaxID=325434 RepID=UPI0026F3CB8F|nr:uncharacterized protein LOC131431737 [Malaya genurostris]